MPVWTSDLETFRQKNQGHPALELDPLYVLPRELVDAFREEFDGHLLAEDYRFEEDLIDLQRRHHHVAIWQEKPVLHSTLLRPPPVENSFPGLLQSDVLKIREALERDRPLFERLEAYLGWLVTDPTYLKEKAELARTWGDEIRELGHIPAYSTRSFRSTPRRRREGRDVTDLTARFRAFYERWQISGLATWDLPIPPTTNLSGLELPPAVQQLPRTLHIQFSPVLSLPAQYPFRESLQAMQASVPAHLEGWHRVQQQLHSGDMGFHRFRRIWLLLVYRFSALPGRYGNRLARREQMLDRAFGRYFGVGEDSIKKLRLAMPSLSRRRS